MMTVPYIGPWLVFPSFFAIQKFDQPSRTTKQRTTRQRIIMSIVISYTMMTVDDQQ
ncbi:hypothetical protein M513_14423, partial [Trichuris suis]